ncbi:MAG TPA: glycosyltransferase family 4 protein [Thermoanaerobaculia bacterium]
MRRVLFVNRYFHPDHSATSQMASALAFALAARGWEVGALTSRQRYDDASARLASEVVDGVRIERIWSTRFGRAALAGRAIDYLSFYVSAFFALLRRRDAVVIAMTDPPLISVVAALASKRLVNWVQDFFPEVAEALGMRVMRPLRIARNWSLRRARANVVLGEQMAARVPKAVVIHNWADSSLVPVAADSNPLRDEWIKGDSFVAGYSGNLGRAHEFETILGAIERLPSVRLVISGGGARLDDVRRRAPANVSFHPYQPLEMLSRALSVADVHLVSLQPSLEGLIVPSKFYGILAVARPVIFIGSRYGELAQLIRESRCGLVVESGDVDALARAIASLAGDRAGAAAMGQRGLALYRERFDPAHAFDAWEKVLEEASA